jgi:hypothetical protein
MSVNDPEINQGVRQVLTRNWIDLSKTNFASRRGIVRMMGELKKIGREQESQLEPAHLDQLDGELKRLKGVQRVHFDLANWKRNEEGQWERVTETRHVVEGERVPGADARPAGED